jgi:hypothetical protein
MALFIDGVKVASWANPSLPTSFADTVMAVGSRTDGKDYINTLIADLRISNRARTDEEIAAAYNSNYELTADEYTTYLLTFDNTLNKIATNNGIKIKNGYIDASNIRTGTLDASKVNVTNLNASNITTGTLDAARIAAGSITTDKLVVADFTNLCPNPVFEDGTTKDWTGISVITASDASVPTGAPTVYVGKQSQRDGYGSDYFPVSPGDKFYCEVTAATLNSTYQFKAGLAFFDKDKKAITWLGTTYLSPTSTWTTTTGIVTAPANAVYARVWTQINTFSDFGDWFFTNVKVRRVVGTALIDDLAVTTAKIQDGAITTTKIGDAQITNAKIASIDAGKITTGTLDASKVNVVNLNASNITTGTMTADKIYGGTLTLGGSNNANGVMNIKDASGVIKVRGDVNGFFILDKGVNVSLESKNNLIPDHSFEAIPTSGSADATYYDFAIGTLSRNIFDWLASGSPRILSARNTDIAPEAAFGLQCVVVNSSNWLYVYVPVKPSTTYYLSGYTARGYRNPTAGTPKLYVDFRNGNLTYISAVSRTFTPNTSMFDWKRVGFSFTTPNASTNVEFARIVVYSADANYVYWDGIQLVEGAFPAIYDPEENLWRAMYGVAGLQGFKAFNTNYVRRGSATINNSTNTTISFGFTFPGIPTVVASYHDTKSGDWGIVKTRNTSTTSFDAIIGGTASGLSRVINWIAIYY